MYDMDMRDYDPALGRWVVQDPVVHHSMSPYNAFDNNPLVFADPSGADSVFTSDFMNRNGGHWSDKYRSEEDSSSKNENVISQQSTNASKNSNLGGENYQGKISNDLAQQNEESEGQSENDDIVRINTKNKTVSVERTGDNFDRIFIDGKEVAATTRGLLGPALRENGYEVSVKGPSGVGMGLTDLALDVVNLFEGVALIKMGLTRLPKTSIGYRVALGGSKESLESSAYFYKIFGSTSLPLKLPTLYGSTKNLGVFWEEIHLFLEDFRQQEVHGECMILLKDNYEDTKG